MKQVFMYYLKINCISMKNKISMLILTSLFFFTLTSFTLNDSVKIQDLDFRIKKIEEFRAIDDKKFENKSKELDLKLEEYKQQKTLVDWIALSLGGLTIVSLWGLWQRAKSIAEKKIEEKFESLLSDKKLQLINIIDSHDKETNLKKDNTIYIIASNNSNTDFLLEFFKKLGFSKTVLRKVSQYEKIEEHIKYDILFLFRDETNEPLSDEVSKQYIEDSRNDAIIFNFGKNIQLSNGKSRFSSASFWSQLYGNLISALKYQEIID